MKPITLRANGAALDTDPARFGELRSSAALVDDAAALIERMDEDGYLYFPGLLDADTVLAARLEILWKYAILGEVDDRHPVIDGIAGEGTGVTAANLRAFSESVRSGHHYRSVTDHPAILAVYERLFGEPVHVYDMRWPRFVRPGEGCGFHCDGPYMNRGTNRLLSSWIPLGRVPRQDGALLLLENSHRSEALHAGYLQRDADKDGLEWLDADPVSVQDRFGDRWLTTDFEPGDVLCFTMHTLHGALDNQSHDRRCRLSSDSRYQPASEPRDERWNGESIVGHGGSRVFYPGLGSWNNADFQDEWKDVDEYGRVRLRPDVGPR